MKWASEKAEKIWRKECVSTLSQINVTPGQCRWNFQCHQNSIHEAIEGKDDRVAMVLQVDKQNKVILHFLNYRKGKFIDNTLGHLSKDNAYYFVKWVYDWEFESIDNIFEITIEHWRLKLPWYIRCFTDTRI